MLNGNGGTDFQMAKLNTCILYYTHAFLAYHISTLVGCRPLLRW